MKQIRRFRRMAITYGFPGVSWWSWQETSKREWRTLGRKVDHGVSGVRPPRSYPRLAKGSRGDLVVWAQEHLKGAGKSLKVTGVYKRSTVRAVRAFSALPAWRSMARSAPRRGAGCFA